MKYYLDGRLHDDGTPALPPDDRGLTLGDGAFETIAVRGGRAMRLAAHLDRLQRAFDVLSLSPAPGRDSLWAAVTGVIEANALDTGVVRLTVTRGAGLGGLRLPDSPRPRILATARQGLPAPSGVRAIVSTRVRRNEHSPASRIKSLSYLDNVLARLEAESAGADDALLLNTRDRLAEATTANVVAVRDGVAATPPVSEGCLPGIARRALMAAMTVVERPLDMHDLFAADEVLLTASTGVRAVLSIDGRAIGGRGTDVLQTAHSVLCDPDSGA